MRSKQLTVVTAMDSLSPPPCGDEKAPPVMLREASTLSEKEASSWTLAECMKNGYEISLRCPAGWAPLNSPGFVLLSPRTSEANREAAESRFENSPAVAEHEDPNQAMTLTLSQGNLSDGPPPALLWSNSGLSGLDFLMSRDPSGLDGILGPHEDGEGDQSESQFADFHIQDSQIPPAPPNTMTHEDMETEQAEEEPVPEPTPIQPTFAVVQPHRLGGRMPSARVSHSAMRFVPTPVVLPSRPRRKAASQRKRQQHLLQEKAMPIVKKRRRIQQSRGAHVKNRPEMQVKAREGQKHWGEMVQTLRKEWQDRKIWEHNEHFREQIAMCTRSHIKSQHECLLRQLQIAWVDKIITATDFSASEENSFLGWTGFQIEEGQHKKFRGKIEGLFATPPKENTLNNSFRRAGLVPKQCWSEAWSGTAPFKYDGGKRAVYSAQN